MSMEAEANEHQSQDKGPLTHGCSALWHHFKERGLPSLTIISSNYCKTLLTSSLISSLGRCQQLAYSSSQPNSQTNWPGPHLAPAWPQEQGLGSGRIISSQNRKSGAPQRIYHTTRSFYLPLWHYRPIRFIYDLVSK